MAFTSFSSRRSSLPALTPTTLDGFVVVFEPAETEATVVDALVLAAAVVVVVVATVLSRLDVAFVAVLIIVSQSLTKILELIGC